MLIKQIGLGFKGNLPLKQSLWYTGELHEELYVHVHDRPVNGVKMIIILKWLYIKYKGLYYDIEVHINCGQSTFYMFTLNWKIIIVHYRTSNPTERSTLSEINRISKDNFK